MALFVHTGEEYLAATDAASRENLEALAERAARAPVQRAEPVSTPAADGGHWTFKVEGTGFKATFRVAVQPDR